MRTHRSLTTIRKGSVRERPSGQTKGMATERAEIALSLLRNERFRLDERYLSEAEDQLLTAAKHIADAKLKK